MASPLTLFMPVAENAKLDEMFTLLATHQTMIEQALTSVGTVHYARFLLLDRSAPNVQVNITAPGPGPFVLGVITEYDGDFEVYIQDFANQLGQIFDGLLGFTTDGAHLVPVSEHVQAFVEYIAANDVSQHIPKQMLGLYSAYPDTVQQIIAKG